MSRRFLSHRKFRRISYEIKASGLRLLRRQVEYVSHVRKMSLRDRARRAKSCCAPLMIEGVGVLMSACGLFYRHRMHFGRNCGIINAF